MWQHAEDIAKTVAAGGRIGVGSHGQLQGLGMHWELWLIQSGGLSTLLVRSLERAERLNDAMVSRGWQSGSNTLQSDREKA